MKTKILKRLLSFIFVGNMLMTTPFVVSATPPKTSKKHCHSYSMDSNEKELNLGRIIYNNKMEEYKKKGYEDGVNNVLNKPYVPRKYREAYNIEYEKGREKYRNKINVDKIDQKSEKHDERLEEYKKKGHEDGVNNVLNKPYVPRKYREAYNTEYEKGQKEYANKAVGNFGYEDGLKNRVMLNKWHEPYQSVYEREYIKGLAIYIRDNLKNQTIDFKKAAPKTLQQAKNLGEMHGVNNGPYRIGAPGDIQDEYGKAYFLAQRNRLFKNGYHAAIEKGNKKTLKKTFIIRQYGYWYNKGFEYGREEYAQQLEKLKKQAYIDGLKKHVRSTSVPKEYEQIYKEEYERGREKYIGDMIAKIRKHRLKIKMKYGKDV